MTCDIVITSSQRDVELDIGGPLAGGNSVLTTLYDQSGGAIVVGPIQAGHQVARMRVFANFLKGIPTQTEVTFETKYDITGIAALKFTCAATSGETGVMVIDFRDFHQK